MNDKTGNIVKKLIKNMPDRYDDEITIALATEVIDYLRFILNSLI